MWPPALSLNRCHPPGGPAGGAGLAGGPARVCLAGLSVPATLARSKAGPPGDLTARPLHSAYSAAPALLPGLPSRLPSPAGLLLQEALLDWEGIAAWCGPRKAAGTPLGAGGNADAQGLIQPDPRGPHACYSLKSRERGHSCCSNLTRWTFWEAASAGRADWGRGWGVSDSVNSNKGCSGPTLNRRSTAGCPPASPICWRLDMLTPP